MDIRQMTAGQWQEFKNLRLEAMKASQRNFTVAYEVEAAKPAKDWIALLRDERHRLFGLYDGATLVGITGVFTDRQDESGKSAILGMSYIRPDYRGRGLSRLLYTARIDWAKAQGRFDRIEVGHREGNEVSRRANQAFGFQKIREDRRVFGDGLTDILHVYEMRLK